MIDHLPEETLREILKPLFHVSSEDFRLAELESSSDPSHWQPLRLPRSPSILLVCKRWLRVATPLFYESLEIRSEDATERLANTLLAAPNLGQYIRRLRLAGGYGHSLHIVAEHSPNIQVLSIELDEIFKSKMPISDFSRALPLFSIRTLHLRTSGYRNEKTAALVDQVLAALNTWRCLEFVSFTGHAYGVRNLGMKLLESVSSLPEIALERRNITRLLRFEEQDFRRAVQKAGVRRIRCYGATASDDDLEVLENVPVDLTEKIVFQETRWERRRRITIDATISRQKLQAQI